MRILFVSSLSFPETVGGTQHVMHLSARAMLAAGHEVAVFGHTWNPELPVYGVERSEYEGIGITKLKYDFSDASGFAYIYRNDRIDEVFAEELRRYAPDVIHVHHVTCLSTGMLRVAREMGIPTVLTLYDFWLGCPRGQRMRNDLFLCEDLDRSRCVPCCQELWGHLLPENSARQEIDRYDDFIREQLEGVDLLLAPSQHTKDVYEADGIRNRIEVLSLCLDPAIYSGVERTQSDKLRVAYIGSVIPSKGAHILIDAVQRLPADQFSLRIHGEISPWHQFRDYEERLRALDRGTHDIELTGRYEPKSVVNLLAQADVLVVPGLWWETYCLTIREGFLAGIPVIASKLGAMAEAFEDGVTGLYVTPGDVDELVAALERLRSDVGLRESLVNAPKDIMSSERMAARTLEFYEEIRASKG